jgi:hypothetical protein
VTAATSIQAQVLDALRPGGHALDVTFEGLDSRDTSGRLTRALEAGPRCDGITG